MPGTNRLVSHVVRSGAFCNPPAPENDRNFPVFFGEIFLRKMYRFPKGFPEKFRIFFLRMFRTLHRNFPRKKFIHILLLRFPSRSSPPLASLPELQAATRPCRSRAATSPPRGRSGVNPPGSRPRTPGRYPRCREAIVPSRAPHGSRTQSLPGHAERVGPPQRDEDDPVINNNHEPGRGAPLQHDLHHAAPRSGYWQGIADAVGRRPSATHVPPVPAGTGSAFAAAARPGVRSIIAVTD